MSAVEGALDEVPASLLPRPTAASSKHGKTNTLAIFRYPILHNANEVPLENTKEPEPCFHALLTDGTREVRFEWAAMSEGCLITKTFLP